MNIKKIVATLLVAGACYMPAWANGVEEALAVTADPDVAYTFYLGMDTWQIEEDMDGLPGWTKRSEGFQKLRNIFYKRTLEDGTVEQIVFNNVKPNDVLTHFNISFAMKKPGEAAKVYFQAMAKLRKIYGNPRTHEADTTRESSGFDLDGGHLLYGIGYNKKENTFYVNRYYYDVEGIAAYKQMVKERYGDRFGICGR